jgi:hypothetical protein
MFGFHSKVKAPVRTAPEFNRGPDAIANRNPDGIGHSDPNNDYDEMVVCQIFAAVSQRRLSTMGEFGQFARPYLAAGYQREVSEAHRRYFDRSSQT